MIYTSAPEVAPLIRDLTAIYTLVIRTLVDEPDAVKIEAQDTDKGTCFKLTVAKGDVGKVIGKQGRHARSLRVLLGAAGLTHKKTFTLDIVE